MAASLTKPVRWDMIKPEKPKKGGPAGPHAGEKTGKEGGINLLGDQSQRNGNQGREQGNPASFNHCKIHGAFLLLELLGSAGNIPV